MTVEPDRADRPQRHTLGEPVPRRRWTFELEADVLVLGCGLGVLALIAYTQRGFGAASVGLWFASLITLGLYFRAHSVRLPRIATGDLVTAAAFPLIFAPLYLLGLGAWPVQVNSDEIAIMAAAKRFAATDGVDLFGLSDYFGFPTALFVLFGELGGLLGGVELANMRLVHGLFGLAVLVASYALFRQLMPQGWAVAATCLVGLNHSFLVISRLAMRENTAVLVAMVAFALLVRGLRHESPFWTFLGGAAAGLSFYVYFPSRATFPLWIAFLVGVAWLCRDTVPRRTVARLGLIAVLGFAVVAGPVLTASADPPPGTADFQRLALLVFPEGRELQRDWVGASSIAEGYWTNVEHGLGTYNNGVQDHGWIYSNPGHGFVDPLTGLLLWIGVAVTAVSLWRRRDPGDLFFLGGFLALLLAFAFVVTKAPNYTRLLITVPFVAYLVVRAIHFVADRAGRVAAHRGWARERRVVGGVAALLVAAIGVWNLALAWDYVQLGRTNGDHIGSTGRYVEERRDVPGQKFFVAADERRPYYVFGVAGAWRERVQIFAPESQVDVVDPDTLGGFRPSPPFVIFMSGEVAAQAGRELSRQYSSGRLENVTPHGRHVAFDVPATPTAG